MSILNGPPRGASGRPSSDRLGRLESALRRANQRIAELETRQQQMQEWQHECQRRVVRLQAEAKAPQPQRMTCATCGGHACGDLDHMLSPAD